MAEPDVVPPAQSRPWFSGWRKYGLVLPGLVMAGLLLLVAVVNSPIGHRLIADSIASYAPASGLRITVGRIEGSLYHKARLRDVAFADPKGVFLRVPEVDLDWRPFNWLHSGLDVRDLTLRRGRLSRLPKLRPGDPDAPVLPDFDIRIDRFAVEDLRIDRSVLGNRVGPTMSRRADVLAKVDIRKGRALVRFDGRFGGADRAFALIDAEPDRDRFDMRLDYSAPRDGLLAGLTGARQDMRARVVGKGLWRDWRGALLVERGSRPLTALRLTNRAGRYGVLGLAWPQDILRGVAARAAGDVVSVAAQGTLKASVLAGSAGLAGKGLRADAEGTVDLAENRFDGLAVRAMTVGQGLLGDGTVLQCARLTATLDGPFRAMTVDHRLTVEQLSSGAVRLESLSTQGIARLSEGAWQVPLNLAASRVVSGVAAVDPRLVGLRGQGTVNLAGKRLWADRLALSGPGTSGLFSLRGDLATGTYGLAGSAALRGWTLPNLGLADIDTRFVAKFGAVPWTVSANLAARMARVDNGTLTTLAGERIALGGTVEMGAGRPLLVRAAKLTGSKLTLLLSGQRLPDGRAQIAGRGTHADYGAFTVDASVTGQGPNAVLVLADPYPAAGLKQVRVALSPIAEGFRIETQGQSMFGPFDGVLGLFSPSGGPTRVAIDRLQVWKTAITGALTLRGNGVAGALQMAGGGVTGNVGLTPSGEGQGIDAHLRFADAHFGGEPALTIGAGRLDATGHVAKGHSTVSFNLAGQGIGRGQLFLGRVAAKGQVTDGRGSFVASLAGRRGSRFALLLNGDVAPQRIALHASGDFAGQRIAMPRRAVLTAEDGGWRLAPTQIDFGGGRIIGSGVIGARASDVQLAMAQMPLSVADILVSDLGLGGKASGVVAFRQGGGALPVATAQLQVKGLTRSGLVLTSRPVDLSLVGSLTERAAELRAVVREGGQIRGRVQGRVANLPAGGTWGERLRAGSLMAQMRYDGPADALWRLVALEAFDMTGPVAIAADATGTLENPVIRGSLASDGLRLQSAITGTDVSNIQARGRFAGSRLEITSLTGQATNGGQVVGNGTFDFIDIGARGPAMDLRLAARNALLLARSDMAASVTGPLRIVSDGINGTIAGRVAIDTARWQLGRASAVEQLPTIRTREINRRADIAPPRVRAGSWRFMIDAAGANRVDVRGLGLDSEWGADIRLRGTTAAPAIFGRADLVRGGYEFAGRRFDLTRGHITFNGNSPPDPRLDIAAESSVTGLTARIVVAGTSFKPQITFTSTPAMPEEEVLARLLFGSSVTDISAPEALQLGAALASLRSGGGLDPINKLRSAIGLDRLRIVSADASIGRSTGVAAGKYLGRRLYAEVVTDGRGYSATQLEFRVTNWLSLLGSVSTIGRQSLNAKVSKDY